MKDRILQLINFLLFTFVFFSYSQVVTSNHLTHFLAYVLISVKIPLERVRIS